jgi:isocitrate/isopropylmalate dehydrogenase
MVQQPERFDVIVAENQHGTSCPTWAPPRGRSRFRPSANIGIGGQCSNRHTAQPDNRAERRRQIAILSGAMMLRNLEHGDAFLAKTSRIIDEAVASVLTGQDSHDRRRRQGDHRKDGGCGRWRH